MSDPLPPLPPDVLRAAQQAVQHHVQSVVLPPWPVFGLSGRPGEGWLSHVGESGTEGITQVVLFYRLPGDSEQLIVWSRARSDTAPSRDSVLCWITEDDLDELPVQEVAEPEDSSAAQTVTIALDGKSTPVTLTEAGGASLARIDLADVQIDVVTRQLAVEQLSLSRVSDLRPYQDRRDAVIQSLGIPRS